jgi:hypothetical protein
MYSDASLLCLPASREREWFPVLLRGWVVTCDDLTRSVTGRFAARITERTAESRGSSIILCCAIFRPPSKLRHHYSAEARSYRVIPRNPSRDHQPTGERARRLQRSHFWTTSRRSISPAATCQIRQHTSCMDSRIDPATMAVVPRSDAWTPFSPREAGIHLSHTFALGCYALLFLKPGINRGCPICSSLLYCPMHGDLESYASSIMHGYHQFRTRRGVGIPNSARHRLGRIIERGQQPHHRCLDLHRVQATP